MLGQELPALIADGYTSFKVYMTYDDLMLNDRQMLDVFHVARASGRAGDGPCRELRRDPLAHRAAGARRQDRALCHAAVAARRGRARGDPPGDRLAELVDVPIVIVHVSGREAIEQIRWAQARGLKI